MICVVGSIRVVLHLHRDLFRHLTSPECVIRLIIGNLHLHPLCHIIEVVQIEKGVLQSCDGSVCIQHATHVEFIAVTSVSRARSTADQRQRFSPEVTRQHGRRGAGTGLRLICHRQREKIIRAQRNTYRVANYST